LLWGAPRLYICLGFSRKWAVARFFYWVLDSGERLRLPGVTGMMERGEEKNLKTDTADPLLRDCMAIERTIMANERTFLSYIRAALGLFIGGVSFIEFFDSPVMEVVGWIFLPLGAAALVLGLKRYRKVRNMINVAGQACPFLNKDG
jgi:putative membrane protein